MGKQDGSFTKQELVDEGWQRKLGLGEDVCIVAVSPYMYYFSRAVGKSYLEECVFWRAEITSKQEL